MVPRLIKNLAVGVGLVLGVSILPAQEPPLLESRTVCLAVERSESVVPQVGQVLRHPKGWVVLEHIGSMKARALLFDHEGRFVRQIGGLGQGPGEYTCATHAWLDEQEHLFLANNIPPTIQEYDPELNVVRAHRNEIYPSRVFLVGPLCVMFKAFSAGEGRLIWKNRAFKTLRTGGTEEPLAQRVSWGEVGDLALVRDTLWLADTFDPWIQVYDLAGNHLRTLGQHLAKAPFCMHSEQIGTIPPGDTDAFNRRSRCAGMQFTTNVINLENKAILVGPYLYADNGGDKTPRHWDVYAPDGTLLVAQMPCRIRTKGYRFFQNANMEEFYQVDDWSDDLERDNLSARIHIHRLAPHWQEALERLKSKAGS